MLHSRSNLVRGLRGPSSSAAKITPHLVLFIRLALATGARRAAILQLTWDRVIWPDDPDPRYWRGHKRGAAAEGGYSLRPGMALDFGRGRGNKRRAIVPLGDNVPLYKALRAAQKIAKTPFVIEYKGKPIADIKTAFNKARDRAGLGKDVTVHILKHTSISWQVQAGIPVAIISQITGTSPATITKVYGHLSPAVAGELGDLFAV